MKILVQIMTASVTSDICGGLVKHFYDSDERVPRFSSECTVAFMVSVLTCTYNFIMYPKYFQPT
jgi:hypothetical protein